MESKRVSVGRQFLFGAATALIAGVVAVSAGAQGIAGKWVSDRGTLDNGEKNLEILELKQNGTALTGTVRNLGSNFAVHGTATGDHLTLFGPWNEKRPFLEADIKDGELHGTAGGSHPFVARRGGPGDELPKPEYIAPPALHPVAKNGLAKTPPMGWNSWNLFAGRVDDQIVRTMADAMVSTGMRDAGYVYVNIDDTWEGVRDPQGVLKPNHKFPDMKALADYVHSKGLKLGIYSSPGPRTCGSYPGSYGHEEQDAKMFAAWGIDYLKYDWCSASSIYKNEQLQPVYQKMGAALQETGRPIVYSLCEYGMGNVQIWGPEVGANLWRTTGDIRDEWSSMIENIEKQVPTAPYAGPGHWNDPDMLEVGNGHMSADEYRTHMSLWALTAAPLLAGNDIRNMSETTRSILLNKEVIAVNQDPLGKQASPIKRAAFEVWAKPLADGSVAVGLVNMSDQPVSGTLSASDAGLSGALRGRDLWAHQDVSFNGDGYTANVPAHGTLLLRVRQAD